MDPLSAILDSMHASAALALCFRLSAPFAIGKTDVKGIPFRVAEGQPYWLKVADGEWLRIEPGDLVLLPHGDRHVMASDRSAPVVSIGQGFSRLGLQEWVSPSQEKLDVRTMTFGGEGEVTTIVGGILVFRDFDRSPFLAGLPAVIHISATARPMLANLGAALKTLLDEAKEAAPGWNIAICRLAEVIFVQALRAHFSGQCQLARGWYDALRDPKIGKALLVIHRDLSVDWTVESLATAIGMSRSRFAARFAELIGQSPMAYQTEVRLSRAAEFLARGDMVSVVAANTGYASEKAFSRAFRNWAGDSPGRYRRANAEMN
ncbi:MAG: AraC family transcriptional regulator [Polaromonas sp.]|uniref:AraC family transcriptional regulator n=1 Tax=Polaromonas sp. TaxID=1869339 RepID=UPI0025FBA8FE|nr:AraC family transcriptional regulator [Polaromonas sp.]MBI2726534.1 AraC family transcriptional regulator [Polaromonas sp.]